VAAGPVGGGGRVGLGSFPADPAWHRLAGQVGAAQFGPVRQAVPGGQDRHAGFGQQRLGVQAVLVERGAQDRSVGGTAADRGGWPVRVAEQQVNRKDPQILGAAAAPGPQDHV
jgi:hypothetical protein